MSVEAFNVEHELRRLIAQGRISEESLHAITGISSNAIASFLAETHEREPGLTASPLPFSSEEIGRLSVLVPQLTEDGLQTDDDEHLTAIITVLTEQFRMTHQHISLLTGIDLDDLESVLDDPTTAPPEKKYKVALRASSLMNAIGSAVRETQEDARLQTLLDELGRLGGGSRG